MTGRELINYILEHGLEDKEMFKDGKIVGLKTLADVAEECGVGKATVHVWSRLNMIPSIIIGSELYIPANYKSPLETEDETNKCNCC